MKPLRIMSVVGARPNFIKISPFIRAIESRPASHKPSIEHVLVHTGQHYDKSMSDDFFEALNIPLPDIDLNVGSGSHAEQVGQSMMGLEPVIEERNPDWVVVVGDVNATCATAITAKKAGKRLAHVEAGLRSFDLSMPEEINRMVTDRLSDLFLTTDAFANQNLENEGVASDSISLVGNIMIDTLETEKLFASRLQLHNIIEDNWLPGQPGAAGLADGIDAPYAVLTLHRPANVDDPETLERLALFFIEEASAETPVLWTLHPRTRKQLEALGLMQKALDAPRTILLNPLGYHEMLRLNLEAQMLFTDSGGLQEECCILGTPCITLRENTERPITLQEHGGVSSLVGSDIEAIRDSFKNAISRGRRPFRPPLWDGNTAQRILEAILAHSPV